MADGIDPSYFAASHAGVNPVGRSVRSTVTAAVVWACVVAGGSWGELSVLRWPSLAVTVVLLSARVRGARLTCALMVASLSAGSWSWHAAARPVTGECGGTAVVRSDPAPRAGAVSTVLEVDGRRYAVLAHGMPARRLSFRAAGDVVQVTGACAPLRGSFARIRRVQHVVGDMQVTNVSETWREGSRLVRASNRLRRAVVRGAGSMPADLQPLFAGLVMGEDRAQPAGMVAAFRASGLSHLTAVSGQNVTYLLVVLSPLWVARGRRTRWAATMLVLAWFCILTRAEPSVLRASFMAGLVATNELRRAPANARIVLAHTVVVLLLVDPMLALSVGFMLSTGATFGLAWFSRSVGRVLHGHPVLAATVAAQLGTVAVSLAFFGSVPVVSLVANPLAVPVAGFVMTAGIPLALVGALLPWTRPAVAAVLGPCTWWIDSVARTSAAVSPHGAVNAVLWMSAVAWFARRARRSRLRRTAVAG